MSNAPGRSCVGNSMTAATCELKSAAQGAPDHRKTLIDITTELMLQFKFA